MIRKRLELALELMKTSDWERFESLCSSFLAPEFGELRTVASIGGDKGRDAELFSAAGTSQAKVQYSLTKDWRKKINATLSRLRDTFPDTVVLIYCTSQQIGADGDDLKSTCLAKEGVVLDIRDRSWFLERVGMGEERQIAAEELSVAIVDPYLSDKGWRRDRSVNGKDTTSTAFPLMRPRMLAR